MRPSPGRGTNRKRRRTVALLLVGAATTTLVAGLALEYKPGWYRPVSLDEAGVRRAKVATAEMAEFIGTRLVVGAPFDVVLTQESVNEWAAALSALSPETAARIPAEIAAPALGFADGRVRAGFVSSRGGWRALVSADARVGIDAEVDDILVSLGDVRIGAVPVPKSWVRETIEAFRGSSASRADGSLAAAVLPGQSGSIDALGGGVRFRNRFVWPNGRRPFRIEDVTMESGRLKVRVQPL